MFCKSAIWPKIIYQMQTYTTTEFLQNFIASRSNFELKRFRRVLQIAKRQFDQKAGIRYESSFQINGGITFCSDSALMTHSLSLLRAYPLCRFSFCICDYGSVNWSCAMTLTTGPLLYHFELYLLVCGVGVLLSSENGVAFLPSVRAAELKGSISIYDFMLWTWSFVLSHMGVLVQKSSFLYG